MDKPEDPTSSTSSSSLGDWLDSALSSVGATAKSLLAQGAAFAGEAAERTEAIVAVHSGQLCDHVSALQERAREAFKDGVALASDNPHIAYPAGALLLFAALPGLRRFTYRQTIGRFQNPESVIASAETKLSSIASKAEELNSETKKIKAQAQAAYSEWQSGYAKLKAARQELQRLESAVGKYQRLAGNVVGDLRSLRSNPRATELRSEAAVQLDALKRHRSVLSKEIRWIVKEDV